VIWGAAIAFLIALGAFMGKGSVDSDWTKYDPLFVRYGAAYSVPWQWLKAIAIVESNLGKAPSVARGLEKPSDVAGSTSSDGKSWGLMQLTLPTARQFESATTEIGLNNPDTSVRLAAKYLHWVMQNYFTDQENVIRSYNGGPGWNNSSGGRNLTAVYYQRFLKALDQVNQGG